jgi:hypothetical protein
MLLCFVGPYCLPLADLNTFDISKEEDAVTGNKRRMGTCTLSSRTASV